MLHTRKQDYKKKAQVYTNNTVKESNFQGMLFHVITEAIVPESGHTTDASVSTVFKLKH